ncbi:nad dependent epimerase [Stemphylium lycopersici]|nr:nad dependent epimerase [Stemphylium lycopersici]
MTFGTLYAHNPNPRSFAIIAVANSLGIELNIIYLDRDDEKHQEILQTLNPLSQVPVFVGSDGFVLTECIAILLYISSQDPESSLLGSTRKDYFSILKWLSLANSDLLPAIGGIILPLLGLPLAIRKNTQDCLRALHADFKLLEAHLQDSRYLVGEQVTLADLFTAGTMRGFQDENKARKQLEMGPRRLFVTGGTGYIGGVLIELAVADGYKVHALSRSEDGDAKLRTLGAEPVRGDLTSLDVLQKESKKADAVINLATAYVFGKGKYEDALPIDNAAVNAMCDGVIGTKKPLITTSGTLSAQADPNGNETNEDAPPEPSHLNVRIQAENHALALAKERGVRTMVVRMAPFTYGRGGSGIARFMGMAKNMGGLPTVNGGGNRTTAVHVDDAVRLVLLALEKGEAGDVFNAGSQTDVTMGTLFDAINSSVGVPNKDITYDDALAGFGENIAWFLRAENRASGSKAQKKLGWQPKGTRILEDITSGSYATLK